MAATLLRAAQQAYDVTSTGKVTVRAPFGEIGWIGDVDGFAVGASQIDAALVGETETECIVAFRGTLPLTTPSPDRRQVLLDWLTDLDAEFVVGRDLPGLVHKGFLDSLDALWGDVTGAVRPGKPLYVTGHSKGGALASLAAARWAREHPGAAPPMATTFAAPRFGDAAFQAVYDAIVPHSVRYENRDDLLPHLPPGMAFRAMFGGFEVFAEAIAKADRRLLPAFADYASVGELQFIEETGAVVGYSATLQFRRFLSLAQAAFELNFEKIIRDHSIGDSGGYAQAVLPATTTPEIHQAAPGVSKVV